MKKRIVAKLQNFSLRENSTFLFDNSYNFLKYIVLYFLNLIERIYYKVLMLCLHPDNNNEKKYNVSICAIFKNEANYLKEWIEYHKIVGIEHFYLYNNFSEDEYKEVLHPYIESGLITLVEWPIPQGQMAAYNDCVKKYSKETKWLAFIDLDEFIVTNTCENIYSFLKVFEKKRPYVLVYWKNFGSSGKITRDLNGLVIEDFILAWPKYTNIGKLFFNTAYDYADDYEKNQYMHYRWGRFKNIVLPPVNIFDKVCTRGINPVCKKEFPVQINHYLLKSHEEYFNIKKKRGDAVFVESNHDDEYFRCHDSCACFPEYRIFKYMIELKRRMSE